MKNPLIKSSRNRDLDLSRVYFSSHLCESIKERVDFSTLRMVRLHNKGVDHSVMWGNRLADALFEMTFKDRSSRIYVLTKHSWKESLMEIHYGEGWARRMLERLQAIHSNG